MHAGGTPPRFNLSACTNSGNQRRALSPLSLSGLGTRLGNMLNGMQITDIVLHLDIQSYGKWYADIL